jgi:hypothetical protein
VVGKQKLLMSLEFRLAAIRTEEAALSGYVYLLFARPFYDDYAKKAVAVVAQNDQRIEKILDDARNRSARHCRSHWVNLNATKCLRVSLLA